MKRIVIKIGSKLLTTKNNKLDLNNLRMLVEGVSYLINQKHCECIVVSSGSITCGSEALGIEALSISEKQAAASIGQPLLIKEYEQFFSINGLKIGQILLTKDIETHKEKSSNAKNTMETLLGKKVVPVINENDTVAIDEIQFGDNDILSSYVASLMNADALIMLTDQDGIYDQNPMLSDKAKLIETLNIIPEKMLNDASDALDSRGRGGIKSKLLAAKYCLDHDITAIVANGKNEGILKSIINNKKGGTWIINK